MRANHVPQKPRVGEVLLLLLTINALIPVLVTIIAAIAAGVLVPRRRSLA